MSLQNGTLVGTIYIASGSEPVLETATVKSTNVEQTIVPQEGVDGFDEIVVQAVESEDTLNTLFNTPDGSSAEPVSFTMSDENENHYCYGLGGGDGKLDIILPDTITKIASEAFAYTKCVNSVSGNGVTEVLYNAFTSCQQLISVDFPNCEIIRGYAFNAVPLQSVRLPKVHTIEDGAFAYCGSLNNIYLGYDGVVSVSGEVDTLPSVDCTIHVPASQLSAYQSDSGWTALVAISADTGVTITFAGDYADEVTE